MERFFLIEPFAASSSTTARRDRGRAVWVSASFGLAGTDLLHDHGTDDIDHQPFDGRRATGAGGLDAGSTRLVLGSCWSWIALCIVDTASNASGAPKTYGHSSTRFRQKGKSKTLRSLPFATGHVRRRSEKDLGKRVAIHAAGKIN
jgi:hypothetical protein